MILQDNRIIFNYSSFIFNFLDYRMLYQLKTDPTTAKYPQVGQLSFVDRELGSLSVLHVGSSSEKSRPACICETLATRLKKKKRYSNLNISD